jgi:hydroxymethylpyrimidine/phosphomethylpyrimidine kinase
MDSSEPRRILTIAGSDPTGGAGIQADLRTFDRLGTRGRSVITAITVQDRRGVRDLFPVSPNVLIRQLESVLQDSPPDAVKTGMLVNGETVRAVASLLRRFPPRVLVVDPVIRSSDGVELLTPDGVAALSATLLPMATAVTPNLPEAEALAGLTGAPGVSTAAFVQSLCEKIFALGPRYVIITGGHRSGEPVDVLFDGQETRAFRSRRLAGELHGSGCIFASALCVYLAAGLPIEKALRRAKAYTRSRIRTRISQA